MTVKFTPVTGVTSKIADVELHFTEGPLAGLKLIGFALYRSKHGFSITFPARQYAVNGERRSFALLRPATSDGAGVDNLRAAIVGAWEKENPR